MTYEVYYKTANGWNKYSPSKLRGGEYSSKKKADSVAAEVSKTIALNGKTMVRTVEMFSAYC